VRQTAELALERIDPQWTSSPAALRACEQLQATLNNRPAWVRGSTMQVLARLRAAADGLAASQY
jgi:hypothetical protein